MCKMAAPRSTTPRLEQWRSADLPLAPFHWEIEFPEVFQRDNSGFDAIVGNPTIFGRQQNLDHVWDDILRSLVNIMIGKLVCPMAS